MTRTSTVFAAALGVALLGASARAQGPAQPAPGAIPPGDVVVGSGNYSPVVRDLEKAIEFYGGLLGLAVPPAPAPGPRPFSPDLAIRNMFGVPNAQLRWVIGRTPGGPGIEMVEAADIERTPVDPRPQDPGGMTLVLLVRDIDKAFAPLEQAGVPVVTKGGRPLAFGPGNSSRAVIVKDPDGHYVELLQTSPLPETNAPAESNIIGARVRVTVADTDRTLHVYRDVLKFEPQVGSFGNDPLLDLMGLKDAQLRLTTAQVPGSALKLEFVEIKGAPRNAVKPRIQDPGAARLQVRVKDLDATIAAMKTAGSAVVSTGGAPVVLQGGVRAAIMPDPDGLYFVLIQAPPPRPPAAK